MNIEEMALKAYPVKHKQNKVGAEYDANYPRRAAFVNGAKAMLVEVERELFSLTFENYVIHSEKCKKVIGEVFLKVQELKG